MKFLKIFYGGLFQAKKLVMIYKNRGSKDGPVLAFARKYWCRATYQLNAGEIFCFKNMYCCPVQAKSYSIMTDKAWYMQLA